MDYAQYLTYQLRIRLHKVRHAQIRQILPRTLPFEFELQFSWPCYLAMSLNQALCRHFYPIARYYHIVYLKILQDDTTDKIGIDIAPRLAYLQLRRGRKAEYKAIALDFLISRTIHSLSFDLCIVFSMTM